MLLISSSMLTVLPTPAPPNRPTLPPLANGTSRSMTLMPVTSRSWPPACSSYAAPGGGSASGPWLRRAALVLRRAEHVHDAAERRLADRHRDRRAGGRRPQAALQAFGHAHRDAAHDAVAELLLHLEREVVLPSTSFSAS
jgi:hypothetical protein